MTQEEAIELVKNAIEAGIFNDLGSGSNVDIFIITKKGCEKKESYRVYNKKNIMNHKIMFNFFTKFLDRSSMNTRTKIKTFVNFNIKQKIIMH